MTIRRIASASSFWAALLVGAGCYDHHVVNDTGSGGGGPSVPEPTPESGVPPVDPPPDGPTLMLLLDDSPAAETYPVLLYAIDAWVPPGCVGTTDWDAPTVVFDWTCEVGLPARGTLTWSEPDAAYLGRMQTPIGLLGSVRAVWVDRSPIVGTYRLLPADRKGLVTLPPEPFGAVWSPRELAPMGALEGDETAWTDHRGLPCRFRRSVFDGDGDDATLHVICEAPAVPGSSSLDHAMIYFEPAAEGIYAGRMDFGADGSPDWQIDVDPCVVAVRDDLATPDDLASFCGVLP